MQYTGPLRAPGGAQSAHTAPTSEQQASQAAQPISALDPDEQPTPPRLPRIPKTSPAAAPAQPESTPPARDGRMPPPAEVTVAKFLSDVADIAPQPVRERQENAPPAFFLQPSISSEAAQRKKDNTQPFLVKLLSTKLENPDANETGLLARATTRLTRRRLILIVGISGILALIIVASLALTIMASHHHQGPALRPTTTGANGTRNSPTPTPVGLQSLQVLLNEQAPACSSGSQDFWDFATLQKSCAGDGLHLTNTQQIPVAGALLSINGASPDPDNIMTAQVTLTKGNPTDSIGLVTRFTSPTGYFFGIDASGHWQVTAWDQTSGNPHVFGSGASPALHSGLGATNTLEVVSEGSKFTFYVNQTWVYSLSDSTYSGGHVGLAVNGVGDQAIFSNFVLYDTPQS